MKLQDGQMRQNTIAADVVEVFCYIEREDVDMSIFGLAMDYKNYLDIARNTIVRFVNTDEVTQVANSIVKTYYLSGKFKALVFDEFLAFYLQGLNKSLEVFGDFDRIDVSSNRTLK